MPTSPELGLTYPVAGGTAAVSLVTALIDAVDEHAGIGAYDRRGNAVISGIELEAGAGLTLNVNLTSPENKGVIWQRGQQYLLTAGTTVGLSDAALNYVFWDNGRSGNKFYAQTSSVPAGTADVLVGCALTAGSSISSAYTRNYSAGGWGKWVNAGGIAADLGHVAVAHLAQPHKFVLAAEANLPRAIGVAAEYAEDGHWGAVQYAGVGFMKVSGTVAVGDSLGTGPLLGVGTALASPATGAAIAKALAARSGAGTTLIPVLL